MNKAVVKSTSLCDQRAHRLSLLPNARKCKSDTALISSYYLDNNGGCQLLMESVVSTQTLAIMRKAMDKDTFAMVYPDLVTSNSLLALTDDDVDKLVKNISSSQKFIDAVLNKVPKPILSQQGFVRKMNTTSRLTVDCLVEREGYHRGEHDLSTLADIVLRQWSHLTIWRYASRDGYSLASKRLASPARRARVSVRREEEERSNVESEDDGSSTDSVNSLPAAVAEDEVAELEMSGDAQHRRLEDDVVGVDINDALTFHHEQVVDTTPTDVSSSDDDRLYIDCQLISDSQSSSTCPSSDEHQPTPEKECRKRKTTPAYFEPIKCCKLSTFDAPATSSNDGLVRPLKRALQGEEREIKRIKYDNDVQPSTSATWRSPPSDLPDALIWPEVVDNTLYVYVSRECSVRRYSYLSTGLCGSGLINMNSGLMFAFDLPEDKLLSQDIINFFYSEPWCSALYDVNRVYRLFVRDRVTADIISDIIIEQRQAQAAVAPRASQ